MPKSLLFECVPFWNHNNINHLWSYLTMKVLDTHMTLYNKYPIGTKTKHKILIIWNMRLAQDA